MLACLSAHLHGFVLQIFPFACYHIWLFIGLLDYGLVVVLLNACFRLICPATCFVLLNIHLLVAFWVVWCESDDVWSGREVQYCSVCCLFQSDLPWASGQVFQLQDRKCPNWSGFIHHVYKSRDVVLETVVVSRNWNFAVLALMVLVFVSRDRSRLFLRPINNLVACMHRKMIILFAQINNKHCNF